jgi:alpha-glucosidase
MHRKRTADRLGLAFCALLAAAPAQAGVSSLGAMPPPRRDGNTLTFRNAQGLLAVSALAPDVVRVRFVAAQSFGRDHSYAVATRDLGDPGASFDLTPEASSIVTAALRVSIRHDPLRIAFADAQGRSLDEDDPERGITFAGTQVEVAKRLRADEHVFGLGEKNGRLDKRGPQLGGASFVMWNTDAWDFGVDLDPLYASVPFFMVVRGGRAHGIFLDNTFRSFFDIGHESERRLRFGAEDGELDYYFIQGPEPRRVVERYTQLTGRMPLPPLWALGYHQCRYSYYPDAKVRWLADTFRVKRIPADVLWLDIHYLDGYNPFTWDKERFPDPAGLAADLRRRGFRLVTIVDPHPKKQPGWALYESGLRRDVFVKNEDGSVHESPVWPSHGERDPGPSVFPDFSKPAARDWWGEQLRFYTDAGVAGIWNDMNEPAAFTSPWHSLPRDVRHDNEGQPTSHREIHNVYGQQMTRATFDGLLRLRPEERPFVLTRATFAGGQRWSALWMGDNNSDWTDLRATLPTLMGLGLSGFAFVGSDIGGFVGSPSAELLTRWLQVGVFYPFMRMHTAIGTDDQEPWSYGVRHEQLNRRFIELRYELLPQVYTALHEASRTGAPPLRPLFFEFPEDEATYRLNDQFLFGRDLLVAPVLREAARTRSVYLPAGDWYDFWTAQRRAGGQRVELPVTLESLPVFVRAGGIVFRQPPVQHTGELAGQPLDVWVYPAPQSEARLYEDAGQGFGYARGESLERRFVQRRDGRAVTLDVEAALGSWRPAARTLRLRVLTEAAPRRVLLDGRPLAPLTDGAPPETVGFRRTPEGFVVVQLPDRFDAFRVSLEP